jgi:hypothetical protein
MMHLFKVQLDGPTDSPEPGYLVTLIQYFHHKSTIV